MKKIFILGSLVIFSIILYILFKDFNDQGNFKEAVAPVTVIKPSINHGQALIGGDFTLIDHDGVSRSNADFKGKYMLVYFGYSCCPDICPAALNNMTDALKNFPNDFLEKINPIFITIDPQRDDIKNLKRYIGNYHESFIALTGDKEAIGKAVKAYRVFAQKAKDTEGDSEYLIDHSSIIYFMDRQGRFITSFNHLTNPDEIVRILQQHVK